MKNFSRRNFLAGAAAVGGALAAGKTMAWANPLGLPIGCQTWPVRQLVAADFPGALARLRRAGFHAIEMCSPVGYADSGFGGLQKYSGARLRRIIADAGLICVSSHFGIEELRKDQPGRIAWAQEMGLTQMMVPSLGGPMHPTMDDVRRAAEEYNRMGERAAAAGIQQGLHNEGFETSRLPDGRRTYDVLFQLLDPQLVKFQFQVSTIEQGFDAIAYFRRHPGRFISMHAQGWNARTRKIVPIGTGTLNWPGIFRAARVGGIKNYFVEMSLPMMEASVPYLRGLKV